MRVLFWGMQGQFTRIVLEQLLAARVDVCGLLLSGPNLRALLPESSPGTDPLSLPLLDSFVESNALHLAWRAGIPVHECGPLAAPGLTELIRSLRPDVAGVACFDRIIPARLLALPRHGFLNVHPSRLPHFRGPEPLFWQFRQGVNPLGVTVHWMDAGLDTGDIAGQRTVALADGISGVRAEALCAATGGVLLSEVLALLAVGQAGRYPQPTGGSYFPSPTQGDFALDTGWDVRRAFNFMRGSAEWGLPYRIAAHDQMWLLAAALGWEAGETSGKEVEIVGDLLRIPLVGGWLLCRQTS